MKPCFGFCENFDDVKRGSPPLFNLLICMHMKCNFITAQRMSISNNSINARSLSRIWSDEIVTLSRSQSCYEAAINLRSISAILTKIDHSDRICFCKSDLEIGLNSLRYRTHIWNEEIQSLVADIVAKYFLKVIIVTILTFDR